MSRTWPICATVWAGLWSVVLAASGPPEIKLATVLPKGTSYSYVLLEMRDKWRKAPEGGVRLTIYEGGILGDEVDIVRKIRLGVLQAGVVSVMGLSEIDRSSRSQ